MSKVQYASAIGSIIYAMICTRPDVSYALSMTSRYPSNPDEGHWTTVKNILNFQTDRDDLVSQTGFMFFLNGGVVSWKSSKQETVVDSTMEAEYIASSEAAKEAVWIRKFITGLGVVPSITDPVDLYRDNNGAIAQAKEPMSHSQAKHILKRYHLLREINERGDLHICKVHTDDNVADLLTKALSQQKHEGHTCSMGIRYMGDWLYCKWEIDGVQGIKPAKTSSNLQGKEEVKVLTEAQRARADQACGRAQTLESRRTHADQARGRAVKEGFNNKWVFRIKEEHDGNKRYKTSIVTAEELHLEQLDVKTAFLHGDLEEDIYMVQPDVDGKENLVCKLIKSFYGLKQAPIQWYLKFDSFMMKNGYTRSAMDHCCYFKQFDSSYIILLLYVHDMLIAGSNMGEINWLKRHMSAEFEMKDMGVTKQAMVSTRPNVAHAVRVVSRFMSNPGREHWEAVKWLLRYLKGTSKVALYFSKKDVILEGFSDADLGGCLDTRKSTTGYIFTLGGTTVSWMSRLQKSIALSRTKAEYMAIYEAIKEMIWLKNFLEELGKKQEDNALYRDIQSDIHLAKNHVFHARTKHIQLRYHFTRELINNGTLSLKKIIGSNNPAYMLTKVVMNEKLKFCVVSTGLQN
ncbi:hypothetical protein AgCh_034910 [Apium graveolens]